VSIAFGPRGIMADRVMNLPGTIVPAGALRRTGLCVFATPDPFP
jgi:hypothetical protein